MDNEIDELTQTVAELTVQDHLRRSVRMATIPDANSVWLFEKLATHLLRRRMGGWCEDSEEPYRRLLCYRKNV
jgi:hypothetical protein